MRRRLVLCASVALLGACTDPAGEDGILAPTPPLAYTRFVNAVNDTGRTDWRFVDEIEYSPVEFGMAFRSFSPYAGTAAGTRRLRIFPTSTDILVTQRHFIDTLITFDPGTHYTIIHIGSTRAAAGSAQADRIRVVEDQLPSIPATSIASRFIHAGTGHPALDAWAVDSSNSSVFGTTPTFFNVSFGSASTYANRAVGRMAFHSANTGTFNVNAITNAPVGRAADAINNLSAVGGSGIGGSVLTGIFFPASVPGSQAAQFNFPNIVFLVDRHPN